MSLPAVFGCIGSDDPSFSGRIVTVFLALFLVS